jgi:hypothetical protein
MRRSSHLGVEVLEGKMLLSGATTGLSATLVAKPTITRAGTSVALTFTETNVSHHSITVTYGPSNDGFSASIGGKSAWVSNSGMIPDFLEVKTLQPGQSISLTATWDGHSNNASGQEGSTIKGTFTISNELDREATTTVQIGSTSNTSAIIPPRPTHRFG